MNSVELFDIHNECMNIVNRIVEVRSFIEIEYHNVLINRKNYADCTDNYHAIKSYSRFVDWLRKKYNKNIESLKLI